MDFKKTQHPGFARWIYNTISDYSIILDLGCGNKWYHQFIKHHIISVDIWEKFKPVILLDIGKEKLPFTDNSFECVLMFDVIEHMEKEQGKFALEEAKRVCGNVLYLLTPCVFHLNDQCLNDEKSEYYQNQYNIHRSVWAESDFINFNKIKGVFGSDYFFGYWKNDKV